MFIKIKNWFNKIKNDWKELDDRKEIYEFFGKMQKRVKDFNNLRKFCSSKNRVCPMPAKWNDLFNMLKNREGLDLPLILNGWEMSSSLEKQMKFESHIKWAAKQGQLDEVGKFLRSLQEKEWAHYGEI